ncbi:AraC family transcriptional regulator [Paenibacillaceae bacterium]|nr:AraC family transcriptional regulator [Paenibacillaceae bacterium]
MTEPRKPDGFPEEKLFVLPAYRVEELASHHLTQGMFVTDIGYFPHARFHYRERPQGCPAHIVIYCVAGEGWIELGGKRLAVGKHQLSVIPAGEGHRYGASANDPWSICWFHLRGQHVLEYIRLYGLEDGPIPLPASLHTHWIDSFERCYSLMTDKPYSMQVQVHISQTIGQLLGRIGLGAGGSEIDKKRNLDLERAIRYMNDRMTESIKLGELAAHTGLSRQHLIYLFNLETGFPPVEYYLRMKMQKAGQLLSLTDLTIKEIAAAVGIADPYYFSRMFKKRIGVSPSEYRSELRG